MLVAAWVKGRRAWQSSAVSLSSEEANPALAAPMIDCQYETSFSDNVLLMGTNLAYEETEAPPKNALPTGYFQRPSKKILKEVAFERCILTWSHCCWRGRARHWQPPGQLLIHLTLCHWPRQLATWPFDFYVLVPQLFSQFLYVFICGPGSPRQEDHLKFPSFRIIFAKTAILSYFVFPAMVLLIFLTSLH